MLETSSEEIRGLTEMIEHLERYHAAQRIHRSQSEQKVHLAQAVVDIGEAHANAVQRSTSQDEASSEQSLRYKTLESQLTQLRHTSYDVSKPKHSARPPRRCVL